MYPTVVVVLAETQRLMAGIFGVVPPNSREVPVAPEARAAGAMDNEARSPPSRTLQIKDVQERGLEKNRVSASGTC